MPGTLDEAFAQADADLNNTGSDEELVEDSTTEADEEVVEDNTKEAGEVESEDNDQPDDEESFSTTNPDELPDELKGIYKSLQADYTRKTQEIAEKRKESESKIAKLEKTLKELQEAKEQPSQNQQEKSGEEQLRDFVKGEIESERVAEYRDQAIADYESTDPRLNQSGDDYDEATDLFVGQKMDTLLEKHLEKGNPKYTFDHRSAIKKVLKDWDTYLESKQKSFLEQQQKQAKKKAKEVTKQNPKSKTGVSRPKKPTLDEAIALAQKGK